MFDEDGPTLAIVWALFGIVIPSMVLWFALDRGKEWWQPGVVVPMLVLVLMVPTWVYAVAKDTTEWWRDR